MFALGSLAMAVIGTLAKLALVCRRRAKATEVEEPSQGAVLPFDGRASSHLEGGTGGTSDAGAQVVPRPLPDFMRTTIDNVEEGGLHHDEEAREERMRKMPTADSAKGCNITCW